jgi:hypothetical protein
MVFVRARFFPTALQAWVFSVRPHVSTGSGWQRQWQRASHPEPIYLAMVLKFDRPQRRARERRVVLWSAGILFVVPTLGCRATFLSSGGPRSKNLVPGEATPVARNASPEPSWLEAAMSHARPMYAQQMPTTGLVAWVFIAVVLFVLPVVLALLVGHLM